MTLQSTVLIVACSCFTTRAWCDAGHDLELKLNDVSVRGSRFLLALGIQVEQRSVSLRIGVRNPYTTSRTIDVFKTGNNIHAQWSNPNDKMGLLTRSTLNA